VRKRDALVASAVLGLFGVVACRSVDAMRQRCLAGDVDDCERVCKKGVPGEGGCFHAAELYRTRAALDFKSGDFERAARYFEKACDGKHADGCLFAAQMLEAPYAAPDDAEGDAMPPLIPDKDVVAREQRLVRACDYGSAAGCKRLGDVLVGKNEARAIEAYKKACEKGREAAACVEARTNDAHVFERFRKPCTRGVGDDCTQLGALLFSVDPPRAVRLFASECELRGVASVAGSAGRFVRSRVRDARRGALLPPGDERADAGSSLFDARAEAVQGKLAFVEVDRGLKRRARAFGSCAQGAPSGIAGQARLRLTVDLTGDVYRAEVVESSLPPAVSQCIARSLEAVAFGGAVPELTTVDALVTAAGGESK
jgi:hypothetical protein